MPADICLPSTAGLNKNALISAKISSLKGAEATSETSSKSVLAVR